MRPRRSSFARAILAFLPQNIWVTRRDWKLSTPDRSPGPGLGFDHPHPGRACDTHDVIEGIVDDGAFFEIEPGWAGKSSPGSARLDGRSVGIVAQQPSVLAGALDIDASTKAARLVRTCDCFNVPLLTFVDVPGFLPGVTQEDGGMIRHGAKLAVRLLRGDRTEVDGHHAQGYGGAYDVMSSKHVRGDLDPPGRQRRCGHGRRGSGEHPVSRRELTEAKAKC